MTAALTVFMAAGYPLPSSDTLSTRIQFLQSRVNLLPDFKGNKEKLDSFISQLRRIDKDPRYVFRSVNIMGGASPEGTIRFNKWLSRQRADRITEYIQEHASDVIVPGKVTFEYPGVDWAGLREYVVRDTTMPERAKVLEIIDNPGATDNRVERLKRLDWAIPWEYMYVKYFPPLRGSQVQIIFERILSIDTLVPRAMRFEYIPEVIPPEMPVLPRPMLPFYAALKTNLLYDAALVPNIGIDIYMGNNWSAVVNWEYAWWKNDASHWYWRVYGGDIEMRRWFGRRALEKPLTGHHAGVYFQLVTYDLEWGDKGYQGRRWTKAAGISYGYSVPLKPRLNLDFTLGVGYNWGQFYEYKPIDDHYVWQKTRHRVSVFPTKLEISLVWLVGHLNSNDEDERRGGR